MEGRTPTIPVEVNGVSGSMILDMGSDISIVQPGVIEGVIETSPLKPYGVRGETLEVLGQQTTMLARHR
jgi:hypothetical protein